MTSTIAFQVLLLFQAAQSADPTVFSFEGTVTAGLDFSQGEAKLNTVVTIKNPDGKVIGYLSSLDSSGAGFPDSGPNTFNGLSPNQSSALSKLIIDRKIPLYSTLADSAKRENPVFLDGSSAKPAYSLGREVRKPFNPMGGNSLESTFEIRNREGQPVGWIPKSQLLKSKYFTEKNPSVYRSAEDSLASQNACPFGKLAH